MMHKKNILGLLLIFICTSGVFGQLTILSGSKQATQYRFVQDIETIVTPALDFKIENKETFGAAYNTEKLIDPASPYKLAIIQADYLYYMQTQDKRNNTDKTKHLKVIVPLGYQQIHLVFKASKGYKGLKDLENKVVAIGSSFQGTYRTASLIKERSKVNWLAKNTPFEDCFGALNTDKIDAFFIVSSAPVEKLDVNPQSMVDKLALVPLENFNDWAKYYKQDTIRKADYKWLDQDIPTYSVPALLVVNEGKLTDEERNQVLMLRSGIQNKYEQLKSSGHPKWKEINLMQWEESDWPYFK